MLRVNDTQHRRRPADVLGEFADIKKLGFRILYIPYGSMS